MYMKQETYMFECLVYALLLTSLSVTDHAMDLTERRCRLVSLI